MLSIFSKLFATLQSFIGWSVASFFFVIDYFSRGKNMFNVIIIIVTIDLIWGILASLKQKKFILSSAIFNTIKKLGAYISIIISVFLIEGMLNESFVGTKLIAAIVAATEVISILASILIVNPNLPIIKVFAKFLKGEIAKKLGLSVEDEAIKDLDIDKAIEVKRNENNKRATTDLPSVQHRVE